MRTLLWHDYETWGNNPKQDFPAQFAAIRTDIDLNIIGKPIVLSATPPIDRLPSPIACSITNLSPQRILAQKHLNDVSFIKEINKQMSVPHTCTVGFNNLRFDDEVTRFALYRNLFDPYAREWQNHCSRWDLIDALRMARTLRPDGINWSQDDEGKPSIKLELLTKANKLEHNAHDALADVYATIEIAKLLKNKQPKLYSYAFNNRGKLANQAMLNVTNPEMILHFSGMYPVDKGNFAVVIAIAQINNNGFAVYDLSVEPEILTTDDIEYLNYLMFSKNEDLQPNEHRLPIKQVHINRCPILAPIKTLNKQAIEKYDVDLKACKENFVKLKAMANLEQKIKKIMDFNKYPASENPEWGLYDGFIPNSDRNLCNKIHQSKPKNWGIFNFKDNRLPELFFRFKARNYPELLNPKEQLRWKKHCRQGVLADLEIFMQELKQLKANQSSNNEQIINELVLWSQQLQV